MTVLVVNYGIMKSISILPVVIRLMVYFDVDKARNCLREEAKLTPAIGYRHSTLSALDLDCIHLLQHAVLQEKDADCEPEGNQ